MGVLLEREGQLASLRAAWDEVRRSGRGEVVLLRGEAGAGKTALLDAFRGGLGAPVWVGACHPLSTPRPLGPFAEVAEQLGGELAQVVAGEGRPHEIAAALTRCLPADGPVVVILEDVHWADDASLDVLRMLARPMKERALLVVASYRVDEVDRSSSLQAALGDLCSAQSVRVDLRPLSVTAVKALSRGTHHDPHELHRITGGNAFYVTESVASGEAVPSTVIDAALARLSRLSPEARAVAEAVSVVPQHAELWLVEALAGLEHLDEAVAAGVLVSAEEGVAFRHELARCAVESTLPPYRRLTLHRTALDVLAGRPGTDPARLAHHAEAALDSDAVLVHARAAAERAHRLGSKREAAAHWEQALRHVRADQPEARADVLEGFSHAVYLVDRMAESVPALEEALVLRRELGDVAGEGRVLNSLCRRLGCAGRDEESPAAALAAQEVLEQLPPSAELARSYALRSYWCLEESDADGVREWGRRAVELARQVGATQVEVYALNTMGTFELFHGRDPELLHQSLKLARDNDLDEDVGRALMHLCEVYAETRQLDQLEFVENAVADCDRRGLELWRRYLQVDRANMHLALGRWDDAMDGIAEILGSPRSAPLLRVVALCVAARVRLRRGDPGAREALAEAKAVSAGHLALPWARPVALVEVEQAWMDEAPLEEVHALTDKVLADSVRHQEHSGADELARWRRLCGITGDAGNGTLFAQPSVSQWRELGCGFDAALGLLEEGQSVDALALLQMIGAAGTAARVAKELRDQGVRDLPRGPRSSTRANPMQLTDREVDVLQLLAEGLPNSAIAERLVLSTKTVDKHVSSTLRKLAVPSRRHAAARAVELGLTASVAVS